MLVEESYGPVDGGFHPNLFLCCRAQQGRKRLLVANTFSSPEDSFALPSALSVSPVELAAHSYSPDRKTDTFIIAITIPKQ